MTLNNKLLEDKTQEADLYVNRHSCESILRYDQSSNQKSEVNILKISL